MIPQTYYNTDFYHFNDKVSITQQVTLSNNAGEVRVCGIFRVSEVESGEASENIKHERSTGTDGSTVEFDQLFWINL